MAEFNTKCPHCGTELVADEAWVGMEVECFDCQKKFVIPPKSLPVGSVSESSEESGEPEPEIVATELPGDDAQENGDSFIFVCPSCGEYVELPAILKGKKYICAACAEESVAEATTEKRCPFCGKKIKIEASICKYCKKEVADLPLSFEEQTFPFICPECDSFAELPVSMEGQEYECKICCEKTVAVRAVERKCPACGGVIKLNARLCKHCKAAVAPLGGNDIPAQQPVAGGFGGTGRLGDFAKTIFAKKGTDKPKTAAPNSRLRPLPVSPQSTDKPKTAAPNPGLRPLPVSSSPDPRTTEITPNPEKRPLTAMLLNLAYPGLGIIYDGQTVMGISMIGFFVVAYAILAILPRGGFFLGIGILCGAVQLCKHTTFISLKHSLGLPIGPWESPVTPEAKEFIASLPEATKTEYEKLSKKYMIITGICYFFGLTGPGLIAWPIVIYQLTRHGLSFIYQLTR